MTTMNPSLCKAHCRIWLPILIKLPIITIARHSMRECSKSGQKLLPSRLTRKHLISTILFWHWNKAENYLPALPASFAMTAAHTNDELQRLDEQFSAELAELRMISI